MADTWHRWKIKRSLSGGGQSRTFLVTSLDGKPPGQHVLKLLKDKSRIDRLKSEVEACLKIQHPNVLRVVDYDLEGDEPGLISEYCELGPISEHREKIREGDWLSVFRKICEAVAHAHASEIVHRDIKPANIFLTKDYAPVVADFGICFLLDSEHERHTRMDERVGPWYYMAPELEDGRAENVTPRCDVYSLGKLLYWLYTGRIFNREKHREGSFNLLTNSRSSQDYLLYEIFDRTIAEAPAARMADAVDLMEAISTLQRRIGMNAHAIGKDKIQPCNYCGIGFYTRVVDPHSNDNRGQRDLYGVPQYGEVQAIVTRCDHCGNVQTFRLDGIRDRGIWHR